MTIEPVQRPSAAPDRPPPTVAQGERRQQFRSSTLRKQRINATVEAIASPRGLGWLSVGLGAAALLAPRPVASLTGLGAQSGLLPLVGLRELVSGFGLLTQTNPNPWLWSRVVGDVMDLAVISSALKRDNAQRTRVFGTAGVVGLIAAVDVAAAVVSSTRPGSTVAAGPFSASRLVNKTPQECYDFWRDPGNLPKFSAGLDAVAPIDEHHARWMLRAPLTSGVTLTVKTTTDEAGKRIAWHSVGRSDLAHAGVVRFEAAPGDRGTLVGASIWYRPPGGKAGLRMSKLLGADPRSRLREDLRRFKQLIETGEVATTRGQPSGRRSFFGRLLREGRLSRQRI